MSDETIGPSRAVHPDLDWSQVRETVLMLNLAVAQIERTMGEGDDSVDALTNSFTSMAGDAAVIRAAGEALAPSTERETILANCHAIEAQMRHAIIAFQFYDKLSQRLSHVSGSLEALAQLVGEPMRLYNPYEWQGLQYKIRSTYTNEADRRMFDAILNGADVQEALALAEQPAAEPDDGIELF